MWWAVRKYCLEKIFEYVYVLIERKNRYCSKEGFESEMKKVSFIILLFHYRIYRGQTMMRIAVTKKSEGTTACKGCEYWCSELRSVGNCSSPTLGGPRVMQHQSRRGYPSFRKVRPTTRDRASCSDESLPSITGHPASGVLAGGFCLSVVLTSRSSIRRVIFLAASASACSVSYARTQDTCMPQWWIQERGRGGMVDSRGDHLFLTQMEICQCSIGASSGSRRNCPGYQQS